MSRLGILDLLIGCAPDGEPRRGGAHAGEQALDFALRSIVRYVGPIDNDRAPGEPGRVPFLENALDAVLGGKKPPLTEVASYGCTIEQP